jgi:hypothetical protein
METKSEKIDNQEIELAELVAGKRDRTSLNLKREHTNALSEIAKDRNLSKTAVMDLALDLAVRELNKTTIIDQMLEATRGYWFERNLAIVTEYLPPTECKNLTAHQKAYLYIKLNNQTDRQRVFETLELQNELDEIDLVNKILEGARKLKDGEITGFKIPQIANELRTPLSNLQVKYLQLIIDIDATEKLKKLALDKFPKNELFKETTPKDEAELPLFDDETIA